MVLELLQEAVRSGEATRRHLAFLTGRVRIRAGRPQLYGTAFSVGITGIHAFDVEDPEHVDERRAETGLEPFYEFDKSERLYNKTPPATA
ncbi:DUF6624 domain-containing protein [Streptomyces sp. NPDC004296]|uniref:DUF6624 domain-containing protein n=1 Tax=Streptomyces sp. NPDC004296 TaxID=3364697 RepID=UPI0036A68562